MRILAISGSLRGASSNTALLIAAASLAPPGVEVMLYQGLGELPHFNPELEADAPGTLKNALDWVVGSGEFMGKPVVLLNASLHATYAQASLSETISVMDARLVKDEAFAIPLPGNKIDGAGILEHAELKEAVRRAMEVLVGFVGRGGS